MSFQHRTAFDADLIGSIDQITDALDARWTRVPQRAANQEEPASRPERPRFKLRNPIEFICQTTTARYVA